ncbi:hypothetical protein KDH_00270 [Dictyobacter sp. S3.2.2.5]|uniref:Uncharacterized protein n=1 Tax=Dictyobacter halimunensis TaxID=3026934 RepID=A0ABQ6FI60_9CHLR|nr:hypothetical protein KDH_00060 [Dictyobacter sp. S3.2.2.5]GLV53172.1 hypothetical protein KDH_00270 [Dictyobacter sp. S3.2.2.5]
MWECESHAERKSGLLKAIGEHGPSDFGGLSFPPVLGAAGPRNFWDMRIFKERVQSDTTDQAMG